MLLESSNYGMPVLNCALKRIGCVFSGLKAEKFDRAAWKSMQHTMTDSTKFVDMLHNVSWEDGLSDDVVYGWPLNSFVTYAIKSNHST